MGRLKKYFLTLASISSIIYAYGKIRLENFMIEIVPASVIFAICMLGCAMTAFHLGRREGIDNAVQYFIDQGILEVDEE